MKFIQIFLLVLIIVGVGLLVTRDMWVPPLVNTIIETYPDTKSPVATVVNEIETPFIYHYECDEHVSIDVSMSDDMSVLSVYPAQGGIYPPTTTLAFKDTGAGTRYEGNGIVLTARGETVTLGEGDSAINCSPISIPDEAPFNFGD